MRRSLRVLMLTVVVSLALTVAVYRHAPRPPKPRPSGPAAEKTEGIDWDSTHGDRVLVLGDAFVRDWFAYWGADGESLVGREGLTLALGDLDEAAPDVYLEQAPEGVVAFFILRPDALEGGSAKAARRSADRALARVDAVLAAAGASGHVLVVAGPLPASAFNTDRHLVDAQERYRRGLVERQRSGGLLMFDRFDSMTTAGQATLAKGYQVPGEWRFTEAGFSALDREFFPFMRKRF